MDTSMVQKRTPPSAAAGQSLEGAFGGSQRSPFVVCRYTAEMLVLSNRLQAVMRLNSKNSLRRQNQ